MVKVAFYKGKPATFWANVGDILIRWWTGGPYSHAEIATQFKADGTALCHSSVITGTPNGVRSIWRDISVAYDWDVVELTDVDPAGVEAWFATHNGAKYDLLGLLGFVFKRGNYDKNKYFCSETVANSLGIAEGWRYDPNALKPIIDKLSTFNKGT
jgi:hypothetical protein